MAISLAKDATISDGKRIKLLEAIDSFMALGIGEDTSLPQLVVVGDQSSGKSSLLERLTGIAFPVASELCTRFATQIVLRRTPRRDPSVKICIIPGPTASLDEEKKSHLLQFSHEVDATNFNADIFTKVLEDAASCMGLPGPTSTNIEDFEKRFSDDVLKIELSGPTQEHLSVVDVPGLFHNETTYQTAEDMVIIRTLIENYIKDSRTIILGILDGRVNLANQEVFQMARAADPEGVRTVGIITKCDALQPGDEGGVINITRSETKQLRHGWFWVKNRSTKEISEGITIGQSLEVEKLFFERLPWSNLDKSRVGITNLKVFLGNLLYEHARTEWPSLISDIRSQLDQAESDLDRLGQARQTWNEQRQFLNKAASAYESAVNNYLSGRYDSTFERNHVLKLRMHIAETSDFFGERMRKEGYTRPFKTPSDHVDSEYKNVSKQDSDFFKDDFFESKPRIEKKNGAHKIRADYDGKVAEKGGSEVDETDIYNWIRSAYRSWRGPELPGTVNPAVLELLFREQARPWATIATEYVKSIQKIVNRFNGALQEVLIPDKTVRRRLWDRLESRSTDAIEAGMKQLSKIIADEMTGILLTVNHYFAETLAKIREQRVLHRFEKLNNEIACGSLQAAELVKRTQLSNEDSAVFDIHDILKAYYQVAIKRFTDNVVVQVVERHYLGDGSPINLFTTQWVAALDESDMSVLAAEDYSTSAKRTEIKRRMSRIEDALNIANRVEL